MVNNQPMKKRNIFFIISMFLLILTGLRIGWIVYHKTPEHPLAEDGVIDLSEWEFTDSETITLDGEWEFYPNEFLNPESAPRSNNLLTVPGDWQRFFTVKNDIPTHGYGTYRLKVILPDQEQSLYGLRAKAMTSAANVYIDGLLVSEFGQPGKSVENSIGARGPFETVFHTDTNEVELLIHVSNFDMPFSGGITKSMMIGTEKAINQEASRSITLQIAISIVYLLHFIYAFTIYFLGRGKHQKEILFYGIMLAIQCFIILIDDDVVFHLPFEIETIHRLIIVLFISILMTWMAFLKRLFAITGWFYKIILSYYLFLVLGSLVVPFEYFMYFSHIITFFYVLTIYFLFYQTIKKIRKGYPDGTYVLLSVIGFSSNIIWGIAINAGFVEIPYYPFDFIFTIVLIAFFLFKRHMRIVQLTEEQAEELQKADKLKDDFLANTSHELRNPLHGIINIAQSTLNDQTEPLPIKTKENLQLLTRIGQQMSFTLNDLLDVTRLKENHVQLHKERIDLHSVVTGVLDMLYYMTNEKNVQLRLEISNEVPEVFADKNRLIQILFNLVHNGIKFTNEGSVTVTATHKNNQVYVHVIDTGVGIDPEIQNLIFEPYNQDDMSLSSSGSGIGLGLSISKQLIELHGGKIMVESAPSKGSTFTFTLPLANETTIDTVESKESAATIIPIVPDVTKERQSSPVQLGDKPRILIVDDDPVNLRILKNILQLDYDVVCVTNGEDALTLVETNSWDLVISDVMMPNMSGYELTKQIRKQFTISELPIILLTARYQLEDIYTGFQSGANDYVSKPMDTVELQARVKALTDLKHSIHEQLRMEAAWLQAQIQPHFLFNTLNTIASLSEIDSTRMVKLLEHFGNYLQRSFDMRHTQSLISIKNELELVRSYLYIEKERFGDRLQVKWEIDEELDCHIPPLSIQPLVENAVRHGVLKRIDGGTVRIQVIEKRLEYKIAIHDNGIGMDKEKVNKIIHDSSGQSTGIGIANTNKRLKQLYGEGLFIKSEYDVGTTVCFKIPK